MGGSIRSGEGRAELHHYLQLGQGAVVQLDPRGGRVAADVRGVAAAAERRRDTRLRRHPGDGQTPSASPITDSLAVAWYSSAVSTQLTPDSIAAAIAARAAGTSDALSPNSNPPNPIADSSMLV